MKATDTITAAPTISGSAGRAWILEKQLGDPTSGVIAWLIERVIAWLIEREDAHPFWHSYLLSLAHLRSTPGLPEPVIHVPGATHEMLLWALTPNTKRQQIIDVGRLAPHALLEPVNFAAQIKCVSDDDASYLVRDAASRVCTGELNPDTDFVSGWVELYGGGMLKYGGR